MLDFRHRVYASPLERRRSSYDVVATCCNGERGLSLSLSLTPDGKPPQLPVIIFQIATGSDGTVAGGAAAVLSDFTRATWKRRFAKAGREITSRQARDYSIVVYDRARRVVRVIYLSEIIDDDDDDNDGKP